jgi:DNA end-binding protein Ku
VLEEEKLTAICKVVIKDREALAALNPYSKTMLLTTLHWPDEVRAVDDLDLPEEQIEFKPAELAMGRQLVSAMTGDFSADGYQDEYRQALLSIIEAKIAGEEVTVPEAPEPTTRLVDLMSVLEASVAAARETRQAEEAGVAPIAKARKARAAAAEGTDDAAPRTTRARGKTAAAETDAGAAKPAAARKRKTA